MMPTAQHPIQRIQPQRLQAHMTFGRLQIVVLRLAAQSRACHRATSMRPSVNYFETTSTKGPLTPDHLVVNLYSIYCSPAEPKCSSASRFGRYRSRQQGTCTIMLRITHQMASGQGHIRLPIDALTHIPNTSSFEGAANLFFSPPAKQAFRAILLSHKPHPSRRHAKTPLGQGLSLVPQLFESAPLIGSYCPLL